MNFVACDVCPVCHGLITVETEKTITCPHCENVLSVVLWDPTKHHLGEIDVEAKVCGSLGTSCQVLVPKGTKACYICMATYPATFECCPKLVELALRSYQAETQSHSPRTDERIAEFLHENPRVVKNTVELHAWRFWRGEVEETEFAPVRRTVEALGMSNWIERE